MKVISVNVGMPKDLLARDELVKSGIIKTPIAGLVRVRTLDLDGDRQADLTVHGGIDKAVYAYPSEHYAFWEKELGEQLGWGAFGENLTVEGVDETTINIGDQLGIGTAVVAISQPRLPCFKLAAKFQRDDMIKRFRDSRRTGFYLRVLREGELQAGDPIVILKQDRARLTIHEITEIYFSKNAERSRIKRALSVEALATSWRNHFLSLDIQ
jgi:MOSC domain-containing protein YiiM